MKRVIHSFLIILLAMIGFGCQTTSETNHSENIIYTSIYPLQFIAERIVGDTAQVQSVYPPGVDAHTYEPTSKEIIDMAEGDAFIYLGGAMEGFAENTANAIKSHDVRLIEMHPFQELFISTDDSHDHHEHGDVDPHFWFDPERMIIAAEIIKNELAQLYADHADLYEKNYDQLKEALIALDDSFQQVMEEKTDKHIIVSHAAYGYWEEKYGITQVPVSGLTSSHEPSQKELANIVELAEELNIQYVLFEQNVSNRLATIVQEHLGAEALTLHNIEVLTEEDIQAGEDYFSLMYHNLDVLDQATD